MMASFPSYFQQDSPLLSLSQISQNHPILPPAIHDTKDAPDGTVATLLVRHLPEGITDDMLSRLFSHYGATSFRPCAGGRLRNCAFVDFKDDGLASQAHSQLNRLRFLGKVITVDRADKAATKNVILQNAILSPKDASMLAPKDASFHPNSMGYYGDPIAPRLGVDYPFPPHLEYAYPPPDGNILTNIVNALIAVPKLYTQVLHLMNKMNIPAPFCKALPTPPLPPPAPAPPPPPPPSVPNPQLADLSSSESELESSEEDTGGTRARKRIKKETIVGPAVDRGVEHENVGLKVATLVPKELPMIKKRNPVLQIKISTKQSQKDIVEDERISEPLEAAKEVKLYLTADEISRGKMPLEELLSLPMFKNYAPGIPATVLYIKNLAKDVVADDFYFIFGSLFENFETAKSSLNIKLMQEGRMRGQAFVTFPNADLAHRALNLVNGYQFKGKPIIIQFGRSSSVKEN